MEGQLENNIFFWQKLDTLLLSSSCTIDRPKGSHHFKYRNLVYPVDYGFLTDTTGSDQAPIDVFKGSKGGTKVQAIAVSADILKKDCEVKLITGCTEHDSPRSLEFRHQPEYQKALRARPGTEAPSWASAD